MECCENKRIASVNAKCSDMCYIEFPDGTDSETYVPCDIGIGGGDYIRFNYCMSCGKIQGNFPVEIPKKDDDGEDQ